MRWFAILIRMTLLANQQVYAHIHLIVLHRHHSVDRMMLIHLYMCRLCAIALFSSADRSHK
jgi:hypothetical protein